MIYADTSALLKRYIAEQSSDAFDELLVSSGPLDISRLTLTEMRCALARRRRARHIEAVLESAALDELRSDILDGTLRVTPVNDSHVADAFRLIGELPEIPLRTVDALHLAIARGISVQGIATADKVQAEAARALGLTVYDFS